MSLWLIFVFGVGKIAAGGFGGHELEPSMAKSSVQADEHQVLLQEMWQRHILAPDQSSWTSKEMDLLQKIRRDEAQAMKILRQGLSQDPKWFVKIKNKPAKLTKAGFIRYREILTQAAIEYFESKGADAKWVFQMRDFDNHPMFDENGQITDEGAKVYRLAEQNKEVFWRAASGEVYGTRKPK